MTDNATAAICELASLYALGALDSEDARLFDGHLANGCAECRSEVEGLEFAANALAFAPSPVEPPMSLRARVLESIRDGEAAPSSPALAFEDRGSWSPYSVPGIDFRMLHLDRSLREIVMLVRAQPGARYPMHDHTAPEEMFMLRGELSLDGTIYGAGDFIRSAPGSHHGVGETPAGCMFLMRGSLDDLAGSEALLGEQATPI